MYDRNITCRQWCYPVRTFYFTILPGMVTDGISLPKVAILSPEFIL